MSRKTAQEKELEHLINQQALDDMLFSTEELRGMLYKAVPALRYRPLDYNQSIGEGCTWKTRMRAAP